MNNADSKGGGTGGLSVSSSSMLTIPRGEEPGNAPTSSPLFDVIAQAEQIIEVASPGVQVAFIIRAGSHITIRDNSGIEGLSSEALAQQTAALMDALFPKEGEERSSAFQKIDERHVACSRAYGPSPSEYQKGLLHGLEVARELASPDAHGRCQREAEKRHRFSIDDLKVFAGARCRDIYNDFTEGEAKRQPLSVFLAWEVGRDLAKEVGK